MERVFAFTDESGAFGWKLDNPKVSTALVICAVLIEESNFSALERSLEEIREKHFQKGEMKSSKVGNDHARRRKILTDLMKLPFHIFVVIIDKTKLVSHKGGLQYKESFYKFANNIVHKSLTRARPRLTIVADQIGGNEYMRSFADYVDSNQSKITLFSENDFMFMDSRKSIFIQLADFLAGTFAYEYDPHMRTPRTPAYHKILHKKIVGFEIFPKSYETFSFDDPLSDDLDQQIALLCFKQAVNFVHLHENDEEVTIQCQVIILEYLLDKFMNYSTDGYTSTNELKRQLSGTEFADISTQSFRTRIISQLRDNGVIISGSSAKKGYKIPSSLHEVQDFFSHGTSIIGPMLERLSICRNLIKLSTLGKVDLFENTVYLSLKKYFSDVGIDDIE